MRTNVAKTSIDAFASIKGKAIQNQQQKIISVMKPDVIYTRRSIAKLAKLETSTASARINSMLDTYIMVDGKTKDPLTKKTVEALKLKIAKKQMDMFETTTQQ